MESLYTEDQWRAIAQVEQQTDRQPDWDGFQSWCERKPLVGRSFNAGQFFVGWRADGSEVRVYERLSGLNFSWGNTKSDAIEKARAVLSLIGPVYLSRLLERRAATYAPQLARWDARQAEDVARRERAVTRKNKGRKTSRRAGAVFASSEGMCHYCKTPLALDGKWHIEHKFPRALFGGSEQSNLVASCVKCNHRKRDKTDLEFQAMVAAEREAA